MAALQLDRDDVRRYALGFSWTAATRQFVANLHPIDRTAPVPAAALGRTAD